MSTLSGFFAQNAVQEEKVKYPASKRFVDQEGKPLDWELKSVTGEEDEEVRRKHTRKVAVAGKRGQFTEHFDVNGYLAELGAKCVVFPNLSDAALQDSYGVMGEAQLLKKMLKPGEYQNLLKKIQEVNGFDIGMEDLVEEAKN